MLTPKETVDSGADVKNLKKKKKKKEGVGYRRAKRGEVKENAAVETEQQRNL